MIATAQDMDVAKHNKNFGGRGEEAAARWYGQAGFEVIDRNWRCARGEIDLIVAKGSMVVFVEVKARSSSRYGSGFDAVDHRKQRRVRQLAGLWLRDRQSDGAGSSTFFETIQFDVVDVDRRGTVRVRHDCF